VFRDAEEHFEVVKRRDPGLGKDPPDRFRKPVSLLPAVGKRPGGEARLPLFFGLDEERLPVFRAVGVNGGVKVRRVADPKCYTQPAILPSARALSNLLDRC